MLFIAGQTAGPIGLNFFVDTQGWPGSVIGYKKFEFFFSKNVLFFPRATPGLSARLNIMIQLDQFSNTELPTKY